MKTQAIEPAEVGERSRRYSIREGAFQAAVAGLRELAAVEEVRSVLRVEAEE